MLPKAQIYSVIAYQAHFKFRRRFTPTGATGAYVHPPACSGQFCIQNHDLELAL